ncbi:MAG: hypothetical protein A2177_11330 [Spirochaetes bacterium RBG_13_68_11]|nr:MAG: hypothetical protein A2177_11330 [Spirochaetes bacterium RBG_13_68_11]
MIRCVSAFVCVIQQGTDGRSTRPAPNENGTTSGSLACSSMRSRASDLPRPRAGVPVLSRPTVKPRRRSDGPRPVAGGSPSLPPGPVHSPMNSRASMNVPVVRTTTFAPIACPRPVTTPSMRLPAASSTRSTTVS